MLAPPVPPPAAMSRPDAERQAIAEWADLGRAGILRELVGDPGSRFGFQVREMRALLTELDARAGLGVTLSVLVQAATALPLLNAGATRSAALTTVLDRALAGEVRLAVAATDSTAGSDLTGLATTADFDADGVRLSGRKRWIVNATTADFALVLARHAPGRSVTSFSLLLVPLDQPGVRRDPIDSIGFTGAGLGDLRFSRVRVPRENVLGGRGRGLALFARQLAGERIAGALWAQALIARVLTRTRDQLRGRELADGRLWDNAAIRERYAESIMDYRRLAALVEGALADDEAPIEHSVATAALIKAATATAVDAVLGRCAQLFGADGFQADGIQRLRAEAAMFGVAGGSTATMLQVVADHADTLVPGPTDGTEAR